MMISNIKVHDIREEARKLAIRERERQTQMLKDQAHSVTVQKCKRINQLIVQGNPEYSQSDFEKPPTGVHQNPFYQALKA